MEIITKLESTRERTLPYFELNDDKLNRTYAPEKWSIRTILHHITDTETVLYDRVRRVLSVGLTLYEIDDAAHASASNEQIGRAHV